MIEEQATVIAINQTKITVESTVKSSCSGCQQVENCGSGQIAKAFPQKKIQLTLSTERQVNVGDTVVIGLSESILLKSAWQVYIWPLIGLVLGAFWGQWLVENHYITFEFIAILLSLVGGYCGFLLARKQQIKLSNCPKWAPTLVRVLPATIQVTEIH